MYYAHFGLKEPPFKITPNTEFFFSGGNRGAILDALTYAIQSGEGIIKVVGEVGSGKTMLCRMLQTLLPEKIESVYLANPSVAPEDVLHAIAFELQLDLPPDADRFQVMQVLQTYLLERHAEGKQVVIFVEEAQGMPLQTLEEIRLLSNLETKHDKLLQIVLFGQPELDENLNQTHIRQLRERITHSFKLGPLTESDVGDYLIFRLRAAGYFGPHLFAKSAIRMMHASSQGLVRRVNILADKALLAAFSDNVYQVTTKHVKAAIKDSEFGAEQIKRTQNRHLYLAAAGIMLLGLGLGYLLNAWQASTSQMAAVAAPNEIAENVTEETQAATPVAVATTAVTEDALTAEMPPVPQMHEAPVIQQAAQIADATQSAQMPEQSEAVQQAPLVEIPAAPELTYSDDILEHRLAVTQQWLNQSPASTISIQLLGSANDEQIRAQLKTLAKQLEVDNLYVYRTKVKGAPFISVLYGSYQTRQEAVDAMRGLPDRLQTYGPRIRTAGGILEETKSVQ